MSHMFVTQGTLSAFWGCSTAERDTRYGLVSSDLDISFGQSGSAVWDSKFFVRALVNGMDGAGLAWHRTMTSYMMNWVTLNRNG